MPWMYVQFLLRVKLNYQIFILILSFVKDKSRLESRYFILAIFLSVFVLVFILPLFVYYMWWPFAWCILGIGWLVVAWMWERREPWSFDEVLAMNRSLVMFEFKVGVFHWDLLDMFYLILMFSYFHIFLLCLFYLLNFLRLVGTHQADLIESHLILCFPFLVFAKRFDELLPNINYPLK